MEATLPSRRTARAAAEKIPSNLRSQASKLKFQIAEITISRTSICDQK